MLKLFSLFMCGAVLLAQPAQPAPSRAPGFCLADSTGQWRDLADYRGKIVLIEFMQTTCPHCISFSDVLAGIQKKYAGKVQPISIAIAPDAPQALMKFTADHKLTWPLVLDMGQVAMSYVRTGAINFPTLYLVDGAGMIAGHWEYGALTKEIFEGTQLSREIDKLLGLSTPAPPAAKKK